MEAKLNAISRNNNCFVVAIFDCCREDISAKVKGEGEIHLEVYNGPGSRIFLFGCSPSSFRGADNLLVKTLEERIREEACQSTDGHFKFHKVCREFEIEGNECPN